MTFRTIHTLDARGNFLLEFFEGAFDLRGAGMRRFIWQAASELSAMLRAKGVQYADLRKALVPQQDRRELALLFDSTSIGPGWYANDVHNRFLPLLDPRSSHSVRLGDLFSTPASNAWVRRVLEVHIEPDSRTRAEVPPYAHQVYCLYLNNVSNALKGRLTEGLKGYPPFLGIADVTFASQFKSYLSRCLVSGYVKHGTVVIQPHADDHPPEHDENVTGYDFEGQGWSCRSVHTMYYGFLLSYKIEAPVLRGDEADARLSTNVLVDNPTDIASLVVVIEEDKLAYLHQVKGGTLRRLGVYGAPAAPLEQLIREKLRANYIYSLSYSQDYDVAKFNMTLELEPADGGEPIRTLAAFEYQADAERLRLITLY